MAAELQPPPRVFVICLFFEFFCNVIVSDGIQNFKNRFSFVLNSVTTGSLISESPFAAFV